MQEGGQKIPYHTGPGKEPVYGIAPSLVRLFGEILNIVVPRKTKESPKNLLRG